ncbi:MAG: aminoacyl-tRNA hydrolase [Candidatus Macondimonas sp.]|jgi:PTH1 family peptidyl-tRNA hydrolase
MGQGSGIASPPPLQAVIGLGNPGSEYAETRHNAGFWWIDALAHRAGVTLRPEARLKGDVGRLTVAGTSIWLFKPSTYMNHSGQAVAAFAAYYRLDPAALLVVHDELDLAPGIVRLKQGGGHGGHNGLRDITAHLGADFLRLRIGIGHPGHRDQVVSYVLHRPSQTERQQIDQAMTQAQAIFPELVAGRMAWAMQRLNTPAPGEPSAGGG